MGTPGLCPAWYDGKLENQVIDQILLDKEDKIFTDNDIPLKINIPTRRYSMS